MNPFTILLHLGALMRTGKDAEVIIQELVIFFRSHDKTKLPSSDQVKGFIGDIANLISSNLLPFNDDEKEMIQKVLGALPGEIDQIFA